jgi:broad specificity phosphatase PhoE
MMSITTFYFFRHGETDWNVERRFQGHTDVALNANGLKQISELAQKMKAIELDIILSSDLSRALATAEAVAKNRKIEIQLTPILRETHLGQVEGMLVKDIERQFSQDFLRRWGSIKEEDMDFAFPGGETKREQLQKVKNYLESFCKENPTLKNIAVSTHGGTLRRLVHSAIGSPEEAVPIPNCALFELAFHKDQKEWSYLRQI